ncbi:NADH-quinone oxidoreductase subunit NuoK [Sphaerobacter thermophilus]|jgi:NADH-quinone oxidoreductase subunit K|uniref:NADH-quinone oxidoreductase subunit K n=1 Tax=Sphaerobacter thermophilus (strain ATCC 49802 / DSM 20745 / KCCM 41009 / NCIMB 13125 / S 6022) TaxID=479434 RepID=D1C6X6_SPHTD|nr:NADH-quinone oxidoreductase subunit NuoK [Sphaerobacter thermophilus]ACZ37737.1 NADH-ubiquinone oxidoreductase chain 4L [Sphaerobacter thermophilus DSM 20745]PZN66091.1 MAG: NADH-quinone oxidoreductase subunit NuoK [Sphaerobacter thermophilus]
MSELTSSHFLVLSAALFIIGMMGVLTRRNVLVIFMCVELMFNAVNVSFIGFAWEQNSLVGQTFALFIIAVAAAEAVVGLGIIMALSRRLDTVDIDKVRELRE